MTPDPKGPAMTDQSGGHTPGPWSYRSQPHDDWGVVRAGRYWICQAKDPRAIDDETLAAHRLAKTDPWEANARLIAAAPDLLAALGAIMPSALCGESWGLPDDESVQITTSFGKIRAARAAITLATGAAS